jgi:Sporulation and spore germination
MIPRYQKVLFAILLLASTVMASVLWRLRDRAHERLLAGQDSAPTKAPAVAPLEQATLMVANEGDDSLQTRLLSLPLPPSPGLRAKAILGSLMDLYAASGSSHPVPGGMQSVLQVFLLPVAGYAAPVTKTGTASPAGDEMAVVNLSGDFAANHPSGIETETLTLVSICATLRANLPQVKAVRFLVDGQPRATLAGHADLTRTYLTEDLVSSEGEQP